MKILVTGCAGFIGFHLIKALASSKITVVGVDNINSYYKQKLKFDRLNELGITKKSCSKFNTKIKSKKYPNLSFYRVDFSIQKKIKKVFDNENFDVVCHLGAQPGVRYSIANPAAYNKNNIIGFFNILELSKKHNIKHLIYASSSSVYGGNNKIPYSVNDKVDEPLSYYAASKKSNELMAHSYSHIFKIHTTGLRFFTVYGPWGRPDMAIYLFTEAITQKKQIKIFNHGNLERDFTYVDDIVEGLKKIILKPVKNREHYKIYNIGNNKPVKLMDFISEIENALNLKAKKTFLEMQIGEVTKTWANVKNLNKDYNYKPSTNLKEGVRNFINWYLKYHKFKI